MKWDNLFTYTIAHRGKQYYKQNRVSALTQDQNLYTAWVEGTEDYQVTIDMTNRQRPAMSCSCPYAENGLNCKHMAAVLTAIEDRFFKDEKHKAENAEKETLKNVRIPSSSKTETAARQDKRIYPFGQDPELLWEIGAEDAHEYRYFDMGRITRDYSFYQSQWDMAQMAIREGAIRLEPVWIGYDPSLDAHNMVGIGYAQYEMRGIEWPITIAFNNKKILRMECKVPGCSCNSNRSSFSYGSFFERKDYSREKLCLHLLATMSLIHEELLEHNPGDFTDRGAADLLSAFRRRRANYLNEENTQLQQGSVAFEPRLTLESTGLSLAFRVGIDKMYVVKNLTDLVDAIEAKRVIELGTKAQISFAAHPVSDHSRKYYDFLRNIVSLENSRMRYSENVKGHSAALGERVLASIPLYGRRLDDFFEAAKGSSVELNNRYAKVQKQRITFRDGDPKAELTIAPEYVEGSFQGVLVEGSLPQFMEGENYLYYLSSRHLNRIAPITREKLAPLMVMADYANRISFRIGKHNLSEFYYRVLPMLEECADILQPQEEEIRAELPPEVSFIFALDARERNVYCKAQAVYGETICDLMDWKKGTVNGSEMRDVQLEQEALEMLLEFLPVPDAQSGEFHCDGNPDRIYQLLEHGLQRLMEYGQVETTEAFRRLRIRKNTTVRIGVSLESNIMNLELLSDEISREELLEILSTYQKQQKYYRLKNGDFLKLEQENLVELAAMMEALQVTPAQFVAGKMQLPLYRALYLNKMLEETQSLYAERDSHFRKLIKEFKTVSDSDFEVPQGLKNTMRSYQVYGYKWMRTLEQAGFGGILADDMGLGKTLQMIAVILSSHKEVEAGSRIPSLIVCPASLVYNWKEEFRRFAPELEVLTVTGNQEERRELLGSWQDWDVLITSYDLLKRDIAEYENKQFDYEVIDEAQYIKNHTTAAAKAVKIIRSRLRYALTGTPIENRLSELWSIFDYLMPGILYDYDTFRRDFETPIAKYQDKETTTALKRMVSPFILRRLKGDVLKDLPDKIEEVRYARMEKAQQTIYDAQLVHMKELLESFDDNLNGGGRMQVLAELTRIRQICCDPSLLTEGYQGESAKRAACMQLIRSAMEGEHKMLIFSQFTSMLALLEADLAKENIPYYKIIGATPKEKRLELVRQFNEDETPVFLISLKAGGTGLNLTGADIVIHYDPWWNMAAQNQATDRAHRIGQTRVVSVYRLIVKDTIEERILEMQEAKKNLADEILNGDGTSLAAMTKDELLQLLM